MASVGLVRQSSLDIFEANSKCHHLAAPEAITIVTHLYLSLKTMYENVITKNVQLPELRSSVPENARVLADERLSRYHR